MTNKRIADLEAALEKQKEILFVVCSFVSETGNEVGRGYYEALIRLLGLEADYNKRKERFKK